jgi:predicted Zn-dependent protease
MELQLRCGDNMEYEAKELKENVNVSRKSPIKEFFILLGGLIGIVLVIYISLGLAVDLIVPTLSPNVEQSIGKVFIKKYTEIKQNPTEIKLQQILNGFDISDLSNEYQFYVHMINKPQVNAVALPGGHIILFSALVKDIDSENELAFILAHEMGHIVNRDHLRGLGRSLVLFTISLVLFGQDNSITQFLMNSLIKVEMKFSQKQEKRADLWALNLLNERYGHVGGATDFFEKMKKNEKRSRFQYYFSTHPHPQQRIDIIEEAIAKSGYIIEEEFPLQLLEGLQ